MDHLLVAVYKAMLNRENKVVSKHIITSCRLLGRYVKNAQYSPLVIRAIRNELASFYSSTASGSLLTYGYLIAGSIELLQPE